MKYSRRTRILAIAGLITAAALIGGFAYWWLRPAPLPARGSAEYLEYQKAFQIGTAALESGRDDLAQTNLDRAVTLIPGEPAAWANRGLFHLRKNNLDQADKDLKQAHKLAPESGEIEALLGLLAEKQGRFPEAVAHLRKAVAKQPGDLPSLFALAKAIRKEGGADSEAEFQRLLEQILKAQPNNLPVLVKRAGAAMRNKDKPGVRDSLERLARVSADWTPMSREKLADVRKAIEDSPADVIPLLDLLDNVLMQERGYLRDSLAVNPRPSVEGTTLVRFLKLAPPQSTPAPPDRDLAFKTEPIAGRNQARGKAFRPLWLLDEKQRAALIEGATKGGLEIRAADLLKRTMLVANAKEVRRGDADSQALAFPGGAQQLAPSDAGVLPIDWDNDFRTDLLLAGAGGLAFWQQRADGSFEDVTKKTGLAPDVLTGDYFGAWAADIEMDGDLDIVVARRSGSPLLLRNNRDGTFKALEVFSSVKDARAFVWADLDNDGAPDAVVLDAAGRPRVFHNERSGQFTLDMLPDNIASFLAIAAASISDDGIIDLLALRDDGALLRFSDHERRRTYQVVELGRWTVAADAKSSSVTLLTGDLDNNGALDIVVAGPREATIFLADETGKFAALTKTVPMRVAAVLDSNGDGRLDLLGLDGEGGPVQALNTGKKNYRWQALWPLANPKVGDDRINSFAVGGEIEVRAGALVQKQIINAPVLHFGLGEQPAADIVRIVWPNGVPQHEFDLAADRPITAAQRLSGSCPFLFTFDGTGMRFAGDFMWGTPLGMYVNGQTAGDFPQTTEWLKIRGEHLVPRDGSYDVRVHANLWETDYFDQLALIVVDHPADTEIHVDERFFLTPTPPRLRVTTPVKPVARAWDHRGNDATDEVRAIDGRYLDRAGRGRFQGVTQDHWVEVELGDDAPTEGPVLLIARGWLHPTNSSINVALAQGKHDAPRPLALEVPDGNGGWKVALPALGFPAGKDKTMLIRLDGIAGKGVARRVHLRTSMEIYWDFLGYAAELDPKIARLQRPVPSSAELRWRGITAMTQKNASSPEVPDYDKVIRSPQPWRDLTGFYTRYGDVRELLAKVDDRYVIANAGDEIALQFAVPAGPPAGWKRDFIWECDGWTRDGDLNTRFGNSVLPLPAHGMKNETRPGRLEDDAVYRRFPLDWRTYHTRYVTHDEFARGLRR